MNKNIYVVLVILACIIFGANSVKIFFIGGASDQNSVQIYPKLVSLVPGRPPMPNKCEEDWNTTKCPRVAVATSASQTTADGDQDYEDDTEMQSYKTMLNRYGASPKHITVHVDNYQIHSDPNTNEGKNNLQIISQADVIVFNGGDQTRHLRCWMNDDATPNALLKILKKRVLNDQVICAGTSAGSMVWADRTYGSATAIGLLYFQNTIGLQNKTIAQAGIEGQSTDDTRMGDDSLQNDYNGGKVPGFGLVPFPTDTHTSQRARMGRMIPALIDLGYKFGIGIDQNTVLYYNNGMGQVSGKYGVTFAQLSNSNLLQAPYFYIKNVHISYLTSGDKYDFKNHKVISNKNLIQKFQYQKQLNSSEILKRMQIPLVMTHLVDQVPQVSIGKSAINEDFPVDAPTFVFNFSKNQNTKGYFLNGNYTVENITVDISFERRCEADDNCRSCDKSNNCQSCFYGMKVIDGRCNCQVNQTFNYQKKYCQNCPIQNCNFCSSQNICQTCNQNFILTNNQCILPQTDDQGMSKAAVGAIGGAIGIVVGIILFFLFIILKLIISKKLNKSSQSQQPQVKQQGVTDTLISQQQR